MSSSSSEKRRSQFIHVSSPSYGGSNGAVPPLPFLPLPPEEPPKSTTAIYAATPLQPQRQPSQGYVPGSLPARFGRSYSPATSPPTPTFPYTPTVTPPVSSYGGYPEPRSLDPIEPTSSLRRLNSSDHVDLQELSQLHHQPSAGTLSSRPGQSFSNSATSRRAFPATTTSTNRQHRTQPSLTSLSSRDTFRTWSSAYSTVQQFPDRTDDSETIMMNHLSRFSGTTSIAVDNGPVPAMPSDAARFESRAAIQGEAEPASRQAMNRDKPHLGAVSPTRELLSTGPTGLKSGPSAKAGGRGSGRRCCWVCLILFIVLALAATATVLGWYFDIYKKHPPSMSLDSKQAPEKPGQISFQLVAFTVQPPTNTTSDSKSHHNQPKRNPAPFAISAPVPSGENNSTSSTPGTETPPTAAEPAVKQHPKVPKPSNKSTGPKGGGDNASMVIQNGADKAFEPPVRPSAGNEGFAEQVHQVSAKVGKALEIEQAKKEKS